MTEAFSDVPIWALALSAICAVHCVWSMWDALWKGYVARRKLEQ